MSRRRRTLGEEGIATVWAAAAVAVLVVALSLGLALGSAVLARHRAGSAADLAALAAAGESVLGAEAACARPRRIAEAVGAELASCTLVGWDALVEVRVAAGLPLPGLPDALARAAAGPVDDGQPPAPSAAAARAPPRRSGGR